MTNPLVGVWELVSDEEEGLFIVTETHFADLTVRKDRDLWTLPLSPDAITDEMRSDAFQGLLFAIGGTYEVVSEEGNESEFLFHPLVTKWPIQMNDFSHRITFEGDTASGEVGGRTETWRRVAPA